MALGHVTLASRTYTHFSAQWLIHGTKHALALEMASMNFIWWFGLTFSAENINAMSIPEGVTEKLTKASSKDAEVSLIDQLLTPSRNPDWKSSVLKD